VIQKILLLALTGALGTLARYGLAGLIQKMDGVSFPWGTAVVNIIGCLMAGLLWALFENRWPISGEMRTVLLIGFMGAFTTFSAFILESGEMLRSAEWLYATGNIVMQTGLGFVALFIGAALGRMI
jgi:CrcB protein